MRTCKGFEFGGVPLLAKHRCHSHASCAAAWNTAEAFKPNMLLEHIAFSLGVPPLQVPLAGLHYNRWCSPLSSLFASQVLLLMQAPAASLFEAS